LLSLISLERMWCISLVQDALNLSGHFQATQDTQEAEDEWYKTQDRQDAGEANSTSGAYGHNMAVSDGGYYCPDDNSGLAIDWKVLDLREASEILKI